MDLTLMGLCGVNCRVCPDYTSQTCPGCRSSMKMTEEDCFFVRCNRKNRTDHCGVCPAFPCTDIREFAGESDSHAQAFERLCRLRKGR